MFDSGTLVVRCTDPTSETGLDVVLSCDSFAVCMSLSEDGRVDTLVYRTEEQSSFDDVLYGLFQFIVWRP